MASRDDWIFRPARDLFRSGGARGATTPCHPAGLGAHAPRVFRTRALAGRVRRVKMRAASPGVWIPVFREGAEHGTRGACAPQTVRATGGSGGRVTPEGRDADGRQSAGNIFSSASRWVKESPDTTGLRTSIARARAGILKSLLPTEVKSAAARHCV